MGAHPADLLTRAARAVDHARDLLAAQEGRPYRDKWLHVEAKDGVLSVFLVPLRSFVLREEAGTVTLFRPGEWPFYLAALAWNAYALAQDDAGKDRESQFVPIDDGGISYDYVQRHGDWQ